MRTRVRTVTTVTLFAVAVGLIAFVGGRSADTGLVKLPVGSAGANEAGDAAASTAMADGRSMIAPAYGGVEYRLAGDLPSLPSTAAAYRLRSEASTADVERLARALGLDGPVREVDRAWAVRDGNRELRVERDVPGLPWYLGITCEDVARPEPADAPGTVVTPDGCEVAVSSGVAYADPAPAPAPDPATAAAPPSARPSSAAAPAPAVAVPACPPDAPDCAVASATEPACEPGTRCLVDPAAPTTTIPCDAGATCPAPTEPVPMPEPAPAPEPPARPADLPSRAEAERIARETFTRLGTSLDGFAMEDGWITWEARVEHRLDGVEVLGLASWLGVGAGGRIVHGGGMLATPERIGDYPLAGVETGIRRLNEGFGGYRTMTAETGTDEGGVANDATASEEELRAAEERKLSLERTLAEQRRQAEAAEGVAGQSGSGQGAAGQAGGTPAVDLPSPVVDCSDPNVACEPPVTVEPVPAPEPGTVPAPEKVVLDVTGVRLVLLQLDGMLVPSYVFELADGGESPPVPAVTDEWLDAEGATSPPRRG